MGNRLTPEDCCQTCPYGALETVWDSDGLSIALGTILSSWKESLLYFEVPSPHKLFGLLLPEVSWFTCLDFKRYLPLLVSFSHKHLQVKVS